MHYMLDSNLCMDLMRRQAPAALSRLRSLPDETAGISSTTLAELRYGASHSKDPAQNHLSVTLLCVPLEIAPFDSIAAERYGDLRAELEFAGTPIGPFDLIIAAHALTLGAILLTANIREFRRVPGLTVENWLRP